MRFLPNLPRLLLFAATIAAITWAAFNRDRFDPAALDAWILELGAWGPVAYVALYSVGAVLFLPGSAFALAGGALFGPVWGAVLNLLGATIGASLAFLVARYLAGDWVAQRAGGRLKHLADGVEAEGWRFIAFVRLVPLFPFNLTNYALGLTQISFVSFVVTSLICMAPGAIAYTWLGHAGREAMAGDGSAIRYGLLALALLAAVAFLPRLFGRLRRSAVAWIEPEGLRRLIESGAQPVILDVREKVEFTGALGHIPGAINIPLGELNDRLDEPALKARQKIAIVCKTDKRSAKARLILSVSGFEGVTIVRGGMERWNALEFPRSASG